MRVIKQAKKRYAFNRIRVIKDFWDAMQRADAKLATNPLNSSARGVYRTLHPYLTKYYPYTIKKFTYDN